MAFARGVHEKEDVLDGQVDLPKDIYNDMLITVSKTLQKGADEMVSISRSRLRHKSLMYSCLP